MLLLSLSRTLRFNSSTPTQAAHYERRPHDHSNRGLLGLQQTVLDTHELTAEAVVKCDRTLLRRAMFVDPIVNSDADAILAELFELERDVLSECWYA